MIELKDTYKPKYIQLIEILRRDILTGKLCSGDKLLSENELKRKYSVSSTTVRKCIDILKNEGLITRIQGIGTFVSNRPVKRSMEKILSFTKNMQQVGMKPSTRVLEKKTIKATAEYAERLQIEEGINIFRLKRLRFGDDIPMLLETRYINLKYCLGLSNKDLTGSLYEIYETDYGIHLTKARQNLKIVYLKTREARMLGCQIGAPAFLVTGVTYSEHDEPVEYEESFYRGDEYEFFIEVGHK